jgi:transposase
VDEETAKEDDHAEHRCPEDHRGRRRWNGVSEIARLGRTLRPWREQFLAYFTTGRANNGGTEAINGIIELHHRIAGRLPQPDQLPAPNDPRRRRTHPNLQ